jgi:hypothetical protein
MTAITIFPKNKKELKLIESLAKALRMDIKKTDDDSYNPEFVTKILKSSDEAKNGETVSIDLKSLWK